MSSVWRTIGALALISCMACDALLTEPARGGPETDVRLALDASVGADPYGDLSVALGAVDAVWFRFARNGVARDTVIAATAVQGAVRTVALLPAEESRDWLEIQVELRTSDGSALFRGRTLVRLSEVSPVVRIELAPVAARIGAPRVPDRVAALGDTIDLTAHPRFANGELIEGLPVHWVSADPTVLEVLTADRAVSRSSGTVVLTATAPGATETFAVEVRQAPVLLTGLGPADTTMTMGESYHARPFGMDANGFPLLPDASVIWEAEGAVQVDADGMVTAVSTGGGTVSATAAGETRSAQVTVGP